MRFTILSVVNFASSVFAMPTPTDDPQTVCQAMCYPFEPNCGANMFAKKENGSVCWVCCSNPSSIPSNVPEVPGSPPVIAPGSPPVIAPGSPPVSVPGGCPAPQ